MKRKMTLFALPGKCEGLGASGLMYGAVSAAAADFLKKPSPESKPVKAVPVNPAPVSHRNWRRVLPQKQFLVELDFIMEISLSGERCALAQWCLAIDVLG